MMLNNLIIINWYLKIILKAFDNLEKSFSKIFPKDNFGINLNHYKTVELRVMMALFKEILYYQIP